MRRTIFELDLLDVDTNNIKRKESSQKQQRKHFWPNLIVKNYRKVLTPFLADTFLDVP